MDMNGIGFMQSYEPSPAKKVADTLPLGNISPAAPCSVVLAVRGAHELIQSDYAIFTRLF